MPLPAVLPAVAAAMPTIGKIIAGLIAWEGASTGADLLKKYLSGELGLADLQRRLEVAKAHAGREATARIAEDERSRDRLTAFGESLRDTESELDMAELGAGISPLVAHPEAQEGIVDPMSKLSPQQVAQAALPRDVPVIEILSHFAGLGSEGVQDPRVFDTLASA